MADELGLKMGQARSALAEMGPPDPKKKRKKRKPGDDSIEEDGSDEFVQAQEPTSITGRN